MFTYLGQNHSFPTTPRDAVSINQLSDVEKITAVAPFLGIFGGFVEVPKGKIFFTVAKARKPTANTPVIVYMLGGPGAPSSPFLACGLGPLQVTQAADQSFTVTDNPNSWAENAHLILVDNPRGCGLSQVDNKDYATTAKEAASDLLIAIPEILQKYALDKTPLYIGGISYGGTYVPNTAKALVDGGYKVQGLIIASGYTDPFLVMNSYASAYSKRGYMFPNEQEKLKTMVAEFSKFVSDGNYQAASDYVDDTGKILTYVQKITGIVDWLDLSNPFGDYPNFGLIASGIQFITQGKNLFPIGGATFNAQLDSGINWDVYKNLKQAMTQSALPELRSLLDQGVSMLLMGGEFDGIVPFEATEQLLEQMKDNPAVQSLMTAPTATQQLTDPKKNIVGYFRSSKVKAQVITQGIILNSGHMLDIDQSSATIGLVSRFLAASA